MSEPNKVSVMEPEVLFNAGALPSTGLLQTRGSYSTAVAVIKPRVLAEVQRRLLEEAALMGDEGYYGWGAGKDAIEGPSEALAYAAARCWGNTAIEYAPVVETAEAYYYTAYFIDLETGTTFGRPFRQSKRWTVYGKLDEERKADVRFQIGATKAARNVILKGLPSWLINKAMERCKAGVRDEIERFVADKGIAAAQDWALKKLAKAGVKEEDVFRKFGVAARGALDVDRLVMIQGDLAALQRGDARAAELYPPADGVAGPDGAKTAELAARLASKAKPETGPEPTAEEEAATPGAIARLSPDQIATLLERCGNVPVVAEADVAGRLNPSTGPEEPPAAKLAHVEGTPGEPQDELYNRALRAIKDAKKAAQGGAK